MGSKGAADGLETQQLTEKEDEHNRFCLAGIARTSLRCGQLRRGLDICTGKSLRGNKVSLWRYFYDDSRFFSLAFKFRLHNDLTIQFADAAKRMC